MALSRFGRTVAEAEREHILSGLRIKLRHFDQSGSQIPPAIICHLYTAPAVRTKVGGPAELHL
jgi:hypothetical protein